MNKNMTILIAWASGLEQFESLGADLCDGVYFGAQYWHTVDTPLNRDLVQRCNDKFKADRKSTRLNSSHLVISYAVFCLKKKKNKYTNSTFRKRLGSLEGDYFPNLHLYICAVVAQQYHV